MPLPINISGLLHGRSVEWERLEFKQGWNPIKVLHTLCAFANDFHNLGGGYIILGIRENQGQPVFPPSGLGPRDFDAIQKELLNMGNSAIQPAYHPVVIPYRFDECDILVIWAPGGQARPYKAKLTLDKSNKEFGYFIRKGSSTVRAKGSDETELLSLAATVPFDDRINQQAKIDDFSRELMIDFLCDVKSDLTAQAATLPLTDIGRMMYIVGGPDESPFPLNVGLLFFNPEPRRFFPATQIDVVWFPDGPGGNKFTEKTFHGPLPRMIREVLDYISRNYINETVIKHPNRAEATRVVNFPYEAIEEAVVNAVYHRSYEEREPVEIRITPQDLVVLSYPGLDRSVRLDQLRLGRGMARRYRNRRIGEFLKELDLTEGRATGIPKILRAMKSNGSPVPEFEFDEDYSYFMVRLPVQPESQTTLGHESVETAPPVTPPVTPPVGRLLAVLREKGPLGNADIRQQLGLNDRAHVRQHYIDPAMAQGLIEYTLPEKPTSRLQQYRLTPKGRTSLDRAGKGKDNP